MTGAKEEALANLWAIVVNEWPRVAESPITNIIKKFIQLLGQIQLSIINGNNITVGTKLE